MKKCMETLNKIAIGETTILKNRIYTQTDGKEKTVNKT